MKAKGLFATLVLVAITTAALFPASAEAQPLPAGETMIVWLRDSENQPEPGPPPGNDEIIFSGQAVTTTTLPGCTDETLVQQDAVLVDSGPGDPGAKVDVIVIRNEPVPPGTRIGNFNAAGGCISDGVIYRKWFATVG